MTPSPRSLGQGFGRETSLVEADPDALPHRHAAAGESTADRLHNRENPSPSEMAEMLREVQDSLAALDERVAGLEGAQGDSSQMTRRVALNVAEMGESLARRVRALEKSDQSPPSPAPAPVTAVIPPRPATARRRKASGRAFLLGAAVVFGLILIGLWVFGRWRDGGAPSAPSLVRAAAPAPVSVPLVAAAPLAALPAAVHRAPPPATRRPRHYNLYSARRPVTPRPAPAVPVADGPDPTGYGSFAPAAVPNTAPEPPR